MSDRPFKVLGIQQIAVGGLGIPLYVSAAVDRDVQAKHVCAAGLRFV